MSSMRDYSRSALRVSVAQICQNLGWNATQSSTLELLTDVLERYLQEMGKVSHRYCEQFGRTEPNLDDLGLAFRHLGINLGELEDYIRHVDPVPFAHEVVAFPAPKNNNLQFPNPNSREILTREEHVHEHLPYMFPTMEDEVSMENTTSPVLPSQPAVQDMSPRDIGSPVGEKRAPSSVADGPPPSKRPRMNASNLPEEAGHSQYEMTSVTMSNGFLTPTRGKGRLPDARTPPPPIRHALTFDTPGVPSKGVDGSEANKENNAVAPASKEPTVRVVVTTGKEPSVVVTSHDGSVADGGSKPEAGTIKAKKKNKDGLKAKKLKKASAVKMSVTVSNGKTPATVSVKPSAPAKKLKTLKEGKLKPVKNKEGKVAKSGKIKNKDCTKKKLLLPPLPAQMDDTGSESRLKELLTTPEKMAATTVEVVKPGPSVMEPASKPKRSPSPDSTQILRQAFQPTDIFDSHSSQENSPGHLVIAEAEGRAQEKEEERQARLRSIDESISSVIKDSVLEMDQRDKDVAAAGAAKKSSTGVEKKKKKLKDKTKMKLKSSEFVREDVLRKEAEEELTARSEKSMNDTINAVIRQGMEHISQEASEAAKLKELAQTTPSSEKKAVKKEGKKKKLDKEKSPALKKKLKEKLKTKTGKAGEPPATPVEQKPFVSDKYTSEELRVYEFGESPPGSPKGEAVRCPSLAGLSSPPPVPPSPALEPLVTSPLEVKPLVIKSLTPDTVIAASSASTSSVTSVEQPPIKPLKIELPKEKEKHRDRDKSKFKERKKEKKRDKEKKKKNKDKDRNRERHEKHREERSKEEKPVALETPGFKIKIKLGNAGGSSSSVTVTESKSSPSESSRQEMMSSPSRPEIPKLVIRRDGGDSTSSQKSKHTSKVAKSVHPMLSSMKIEPSDSPPVLKREVTPPPPVLLPSPPFPATLSSPHRQRSQSPRRGSPRGSPVEKHLKQSPSKYSFERGRSPIKSVSSPVCEPFLSSVSSPAHGRPTHSPPPRTPSPPRKSPSPMPKTPSPLRHRVPSSPTFMSSPLQHSPSNEHKSPTPTPKTPSLSPAYLQSSPAHSDHSPSREKSPPPVIKPLFGTPERDTSPPPSPLFANVPSDGVKQESKPKPLTTSVKPKGKVGRPRSKSSPRATSPRAKSSKGPKSPKAGFPKVGKSPKVRAGKSPGRPPKTKTLAAAAAAAAAATATEISQPKPKPKFSPAKSSFSRLDSMDDESLLPSPVAGGSQRPELELSPGSPSPTLLGSSRGQRTVEAETIGFFIDESGQKIWICPACKMQDDGSPMIGCDKCDDWYHWVCVNIVQAPPEDEQWYCPRCNAKARSKAKPFKPKGKRGRKKKVP